MYSSDCPSGMIDKSEPRADVCNVLGSGEFFNSLKILSAWADIARGDLESSEFYRIHGKPELVWVQCYTMSTTDVKPVCGLMKALE